MSMMEEKNTLFPSLATTNNMKTKKFRLTLDVEFDPQGVGGVELRRHLIQVVRDAVNNGTLTGDTPATVEGYDFSVKELKS